MNWQAVQAVAELAAALGVLISLVYLAAQVRQNTASVRSATVVRSSEIMNRTRNILWQTPEAARIYLLALGGEGIEDATDASRTRLLLLALGRDYEAIYYQYVAGQLPEGMWDSWRKEMLLIFSTPGGRDSLEAMSGDLLSDDFTAFLRAEVSRLESPTLERLRANWNEAGRRRREAKS